MGFMDNWKGKFNNKNNGDLVENFEEDNFEEISEEPKMDNIINFPREKDKSQLEVVVIEPVSFDEVKQIADYINEHKPVVLNLENTNPDVAKRIIDFISGTTYALEGAIRKVGKHVFMCAPSNVSVDFNEELGKTTAHRVMPWEK